MNQAIQSLSQPTPKSVRDSLSDLLLDVITSPNQGAASLAKSCASVALAFSHLSQSDARMAARHAITREKSLIRALARAIQIVEMTDIDEAVRIVSELEGDLAPLVGAPVVLDCSPIEIIAPIEEPLCAFGDVCAHRSNGGA